MRNEETEDTFGFVLSKNAKPFAEGRGGGKPEMVQGSVKGTEDAVKEIIARYQ